MDAGAPARWRTEASRRGGSGAVEDGGGAGAVENGGEAAPARWKAEAALAWWRAGGGGRRMRNAARLGLLCACGINF